MRFLPKIWKVFDSSDEDKAEAKKITASSLALGEKLDARLEKYQRLQAEQQEVAEELRIQRRQNHFAELIQNIPIKLAPEE